MIFPELKLISDIKKFAEIFQVSERIEDPFPSLPLRNAGELLIGDYADYQHVEFLPFLQTLMNITGEKSCYFLPLELHAIAYFFDYHKKYPLFEITAETTTDEYSKVLYYEFFTHSPENILERTSEVHVVYPLSLNWYIYAGRYHGLSVLRVLSSKDKYKLPEIREAYPFKTFTLDQAIEWVKENNEE